MEKHKDIQWDLSDIDPSFVCGVHFCRSVLVACTDPIFHQPILHEVVSPLALDVSMLLFYFGVLADSRNPPPDSDLTMAKTA